MTLWHGLSQKQMKKTSADKNKAGGDPGLKK
jgi:hypothetical protein